MKKSTMLFFVLSFILNVSLLAQDLTGTWVCAGAYKAEWFQEGQNVYSIYNVGHFKHYLSGRLVSANQIEAQVVRIDVNNGCRTSLTFRYTLTGNTLTGSWTANDGNCDLQRGQTGDEAITRTTATARPMNTFGGAAFNPANDVTGSWSWEDDWLQDGQNVYYIANGNGYKQFFRGTRSGNRITGELIRYSPDGCRMILNQTFTQTDANTMQYNWVGIGNCDITNGQTESGTIVRKGGTTGGTGSNSRRTAFNPQTHGFKFINDFIVEIGFAGINARFDGQCGGMAYSALDYFKSNRPVPTQDFRPFTGSTLQTYIYRRQLNSLGDNVDKWGELIVNPLGWRTNEFFNWGIQGSNGGRIQELREAIDAGGPIPLGLFKAGNGGAGPHHQVLAIGYDMGRYRGDLGEFKEDFKIFIYDPNHPNETVTLRPHVGGESYYAYDEHPNERWQTYFVDKKYKPAQPPQIDFPIMQTTGSVSQIMLEIRTGGDDLRGTNDNVNAVINFTDGTSQVVNNINNRARWIDNYDQAVPIRLNRARPLNQIRDVTLTTTLGGGWNGDNWNMDRIRIIAIDGNTSRQVFLRSGTPLVRFTGSNTPFVCRL